MSKMRRGRQGGFTISKLLMISAVVGVFALLGMKLAPEYIEFYKIRSIVKAAAEEANANPNATVADVKHSFTQRAEIDHIKGMGANDLDISKEGNEIVVSFGYQRIVPLFSNISVMIDFAGSSAK